MYDSYPYIEPCCFQKQLPEVFSLAEQRGSATYLSNSDWTLAQLLEWLAWQIPGSELTLCLMRIKEQTLTTLSALLAKSIYHSSIKQTIPLISHLNLITTGQDSQLILNHLSTFLPSQAAVHGCSPSLNPQPSTLNPQPSSLQPSAVAPSGSPSTLTPHPSPFLTLATYPRLAFRAALIKDVTNLTNKAYIIQGTLNQEPLNALQCVTITSGINPYNELHRPLSSILRLNPSL